MARVADLARCAGGIPVRAADVIARRLHDAGCRHVFGIPGGEVLALLDAFAGAGLRFVLCRHENAGGFMAEGTYHATGAPGVLLATLGPGVANAVNVVANAQQDRIPLLFLTGCIDADEASSYTHQIFDHQAVLRPITKASLRVPAEAVAETIDRAIAIALSGRPGPVHLDVPISVATGAAVLPAPAAAPAQPVVPDGLDEVFPRVAAADRPLVLAGMDVLHHDAAAAVRRFAEASGAPVVTTYRAKGVLPEDHPLSIGCAALSPLADRILLPLLGQADLIVAAGYDPIEMRRGWRDPWPADANVIELVAESSTHGMHRSRWSFVGDVGAALDRLTSAVVRRASWSSGPPAAARGALEDAFRAPPGEWGPHAVVETLASVWPEDGVLTVDTGAHRILLNQMWRRCARPRSILQSMGLCTMGCALPLAIGAKLADPSRPVVALVGDGGLSMVLGEVATLHEVGLPVVVLVIDDGSLALIDKKQRSAGYAPCGVDTGDVDYAAIASAFGLAAARADSVDSLRQALSAALAREAPSVVVSRCDRTAYDGRI